MANPLISNTTFTSNHFTKVKGPIDWRVPADGNLHTITIPLVNHTGQESFAILDDSNVVVTLADINSISWSQGGVTLNVSLPNGYAATAKVLVYSPGSYSQEFLTNDLKIASTVTLTPGTPLGVISGEVALDWLDRAGKFTSAQETKLNSVAPNANNYNHPNHTGEVTSVGDGVQTVNKLAISNKTLVVVDRSDKILIGDASDNDNLKHIIADQLMTEPAYSEDLSTFNTTSSVELQVLTLSKPVVAGKKYYVHWGYLLQGSNTSGDAQGRVRVTTPSVKVLQFVNKESKDVLNRYNCGSMIEYIPPSNGTMTVEITLANAGSGTSSLINPRLLILDYKL